jgi:hypothetical protein
MANGKWQMLQINNLFLRFAICLLPFAFCHSVSAVDTSARLFFGDANLSFIFPLNWTFQSDFPKGALFTKTTTDGSQAVITLSLSEPSQDKEMSSDVTPQRLKAFAEQDLANHQAGVRTLSEQETVLAGRNALQIDWESGSDSSTLAHQSIYFFNGNRFYDFTLQASTGVFPWLASDYQGWLTSLRILSRRNSGALDDPAHGGLWIHQDGGVRIAIPDDWLIGVADDEMVGAAFVQNDLHSEFTATVEVSTNAAATLSSREKKEARKTLRRKGLRITTESEELFNGLPAYRLTYEGWSHGRLVAGQDLWVITPKSHCLFNFEADSDLFAALSDQYTQILKHIQLF